MLSSAPRKTRCLRSRPELRTPTVCVVDPQASDYQDWHSFAEQSGLRVQIVGNAEAALRLGRTQPIDLWVVNTRLPALSGCELCSILKAHAPRVPVYLVTDDYSADEERMAWRAGATLFGCKGSQDEWLRQWIEHLQRIDHC